MKVLYPLITTGAKIRPWALGRWNWLFAGSLHSRKRAAAIMSLIQSARLNGHDPYAYLKDVLTRLPTQRASEITELLLHKWTSIQSLNVLPNTFFFCQIELCNRTRKNRCSIKGTYHPYPSQYGV
jgi:hypothetical protein